MQITSYNPPSTPHEGRIAIVIYAGWDAVDAGSALDEMRCSGLQKRVVLTPQRRRQAGVSAPATVSTT